MKNCLGQAIETFGRLDFAFNNAGVEQKLALTAETRSRRVGPCD